jgi:AraC family transcriptional regulator
MEAKITFHIKNMVCRRCVLIVENLLASLQIEKAGVSMGKIIINYHLETNRRQELAERLYNVGLEIIESRVNQLVEDIKQSVRDYLAMGIDAQQYRLSDFVAAKLPYDFGYLSDLFSKIEGITVERFFIMQRLEKVKKLLTYDQLSLSEISFETGFSSVHHLSAQFKKFTGITASQYKQIGEKVRKPLDLIEA